MSPELETGIRIGCFAAAFALLAAWELRLPRRPLSVAKAPRWLNNLGLVVLNTVAMRLIVPITAVGTALVAETRGWGVLNLWPAPEWIRFIVAVAALDFAIYLQHVLFHAVPVFWRLHKVHHADLDLDVTTGLRFHTLEILLSAFIKVGVVFALGASPSAVMTFEVLLNATSMFNHSNGRLPLPLDRLLRMMIVTPDMHRVHHSTDPRETNSNFGFNLPWWDFLLGTYRAQPAAGHDGVQIGLAEIRDERQADRLVEMLAMPFVGDASSQNSGRSPDGTDDSRKASRSDQP